MLYSHRCSIYIMVCNKCTNNKFSRTIDKSLYWCAYNICCINQTAACLKSRSAARCIIRMPEIVQAYSFPSCYLVRFLYYVVHMATECLVSRSAARCNNGVVDMVQADIFYSFPSCYLVHSLYYVVHMTA